jgi:hypothetical protein
MNLVQKLLTETEPLKKDFLEKTKEFAEDSYKQFQDKVSWGAEEWCKYLNVEPEYRNTIANKNGELVTVKLAHYPTGFFNTEKSKNLDALHKQVFKVKSYTKEEFLELELNKAMKHYLNSIEKLAHRIKSYGLDECKLKLETTYIDQNISTLLTDGNKTIKAFTILAWGQIQKPHYRYLIKTK